ncbi:hypothetical protein ABTZ46_10355 [Nocardioides sp. NPDC126508]
MERMLTSIASAFVAMVAIFGLAIPTSSAAAVPAAVSPASDVTIQAPFGGCNGFAWLVLNRSEVRITATSDTVRRILGSREYGLFWINILNSDRVSQHSGAYNLSRYSGFSHVFTVKNDWYMAISITNDSNTTTLCSSTSQR